MSCDGTQGDLVFVADTQRRIQEGVELLTVLYNFIGPRRHGALHLQVGGLRRECCVESGFD